MSAQRVLLHDLETDVGRAMKPWDDPLHEDDVEWLRSKRDHPSYRPFFIPVPSSVCGGCGRSFRKGSLTRPPWRDDGPMKCSGCISLERRSPHVPGVVEERRRAHQDDLKERRKLLGITRPQGS